MKKYDVFISYAIEDKFPTAAGIAERLKKSGLKVYFVGDRLASGDLISDTVNHGLEESHFCVLIISPHYVRTWPAIEKNYILNREKKEGKKLVFPVWNNISIDEVKQKFPELIDYYAPSIDLGIDAVADHLQRAIHKRKQEEVKRKQEEEVKSTRSPTGKILLLVIGIVLLLLALYLLIDNGHYDPPIHNTQPLSPDQ